MNAHRANRENPMKKSLRPFLSPLLAGLLLCLGIASATAADESPKKSAAAAGKSADKPKASASDSTSTAKASGKADKSEKSDKSGTSEKTDKAEGKSKGTGTGSAGLSNMGTLFGGGGKEGGGDFHLIGGPNTSGYYEVSKEGVAEKVIFKDKDTFLLENSQGKIRCESLTYVESTKQAVALGNPVRITQPDMVATGKKLEVFMEERKYVLTGNPVITQKGSTMQCEKVTIIRGEDGSSTVFTDSVHDLNSVSQPDGKKPAPTVSPTPSSRTKPANDVIEITDPQTSMKQGTLLPGFGKPSTESKPKNNP